MLLFHFENASNAVKWEFFGNTTLGFLISVACV